jgi:hypothetical protein
LQFCAIGAILQTKAVVGLKPAEHQHQATLVLLLLLVVVVVAAGLVFNKHYYEVSDCIIMWILIHFGSMWLWHKIFNVYPQNMKLPMKFVVCSSSISFFHQENFMQIGEGGLKVREE